MATRPTPFKTPGDPQPSTRGRAKIAPGVNALAVQKHLRQEGYNLPLTGQLDEITKSAMADYQAGVNKRNPKRWNYMNEPLKPGKQGGQVSTVPGPRTAKNPTGQYSVPSKKKGGNKGRARPSGASGAGAAGAYAGEAPSPGPAMDYAALASAVGLDPSIFRGLNPNVGNLIPLSLANRGAKVMGPAEQEQLIRSLIGDQYTRQESLFAQQQARQEAQNRMNLANIRSWYDQVIGAQGVAAGRSAAFGDAAVDSARGAAQSIVSAIGGSDNLGSGVAAAAGMENVGNLEAISTIQDQYNADIGPLLQAEAAGAAAREQALGSSRNQELAMKLAEMQMNRSSAEADLRFKLWQSNNEVLNAKLQNELAIRQANTGLRQQRFQNNTGLRQMLMAAQASATGNVVDVANIAQRDASDRAAIQAAQMKERNRILLEQAKEAGRNYRARLGAKGKNPSRSFVGAKGDERDEVWETIANRIEASPNLTPQQQINLAAAIVRGWWPGANLKNRAVQEFIRDAINAGVNPDMYS